VTVEGSRLALGSLLGRANARSWLRLAPFAIAVVAAVIGILVVARPAAAVGPAGICVSETLVGGHEKLPSDGHESARWRS